MNRQGVLLRAIPQCGVLLRAIPQWYHCKTGRGIAPSNTPMRGIAQSNTPMEKVLIQIGVLLRAIPQCGVLLRAIPQWKKGKTNRGIAQSKDRKSVV